MWSMNSEFETEVPKVRESLCQSGTLRLQMYDLQRGYKSAGGS
jgi:hypothetical protein